MDERLPSALSSQSRADQLAALVRVGDAQSRLLSCPLASLAEELVAAIHSVTAAQGVCLVRVGAADSAVTVVASTTALPPVGAISGSLLARARASGAPVHIDDTWGQRASFERKREIVRSVLASSVYVTGGDVLMLTAWHEHPNMLDDVDGELTAQLGALARHRWESRSTGLAKAALTALAEDLSDSVIITEGSDSRITFANEAARTILNDRANHLVGLPAKPRRWVWRGADGTILKELPQQTVQRTGKAIYDQRLTVTPQGIDPSTPEGKATTRTLLTTVLPLIAPDGSVSAISRSRQLSENGTEADQESVERMATLDMVRGLAWWTYEPESQVIVWNPGMYEVAGLDPYGPRVTREEFIELTHPDDRWMFADPQAGTAPAVGTMNYRLVRSSGEVRYLSGWYRRYTTAAGQMRIIGTCIDDTERELALVAMADRRYQFERAFDGSPYGTAMVSLAAESRGHLIRINRALADLLVVTYPKSTTTVEELLAVHSEAGIVALRLAQLHELAERGERAMYQLLRLDGSFAWVWISAIAIDDVESDDPFMLVHVLDVTSQQVQREALETLARTDTLTGLANRAVLTATLEEVCSLGLDARVLMLDLDRFKAINDGHGHHIGDELLIAVTERLRRLAPVSSTLGRLGGDEFILIVYSADDDFVDELAERVVADVGRPYDLPSGRRLVTGVSLGIAATDRLEADQAQTSAGLLRDADLAMYGAKERGGSRVVWCDDRLRATSARRRMVEEVLRRGIEESNFLVYRQPIIRLDNFGLAGHEALVRLRDPEVGLLTPGDFVDLAEQTGLIADVDHWMLSHVLDIVAADRRYRADPSLQVSVNFSAQTVQRDDVVLRVRRNVERHVVEMKRLIIEITESSLLIDNGSWMDSLRQLRDDEVQLAIDDFGTGWSGFAYLHTLSPDRLKIDRSFVTALDQRGSKAASTIKAIITMAHAHGAKVVAEGVETESQAKILRQLGCDYAQGYLYGRPVLWTVPAVR